MTRKAKPPVMLPTPWVARLVVRKGRERRVRDHRRAHAPQLLVAHRVDQPLVLRLPPDCRRAAGGLLRRLLRRGGIRAKALTQLQHLKSTKSREARASCSLSSLYYTVEDGEGR